MTEIDHTIQDSTLQQYVRALIFASPEPITVGQLIEAIIAYTDVEVTEREVRAAVDQVKIKYRQDENQVQEIVEIEGGLQYMTKTIYAPLIEAHVRQQRTKKLSKSALETLSVIAYKQPVTKAELEFVRGVSCDYSIQKLLEKDLVSIVGRADKVGKPLLYGTSSKFMNHFGLERIEDLPKLSELAPTAVEALEQLSVPEDSPADKSKHLGTTTTDQPSSEQ